MFQPAPRQALLAVLSVYGLFWMLLGWTDGPRHRPVPADTSIRLPPPPAGTPGQQAAYRQALAEISSYSSATDSFGCPGESLVTVGFDSAQRGLGGAIADYATLWSFSRRFGLRGWLLPTLADRLGAYFSTISLPVIPPHCQPHRFLRCTLSRDNCRRMRGKQRRNIWIEPDTLDPALFDAVRLELRHELQLPEPVRRAAQLRIRRLRRSHAAREDVTVIGVHVSHAERDPWLAQGEDDSSPEVGYFRQAMAHYRHRHGACLFLTVCDDPEWCSKHLSAPDVVVAGGGDEDSAVSDLALLTACEHMVVSGAFGFFAAYLTGGDLVAPANASDMDLTFTHERLREMKNLNIILLDVNEEL